MTRILDSMPPPLPKNLPACLNQCLQAYRKIRPHFQGFLERYSREPFVILDSSRVVLAVLERTIPTLQHRLGDKFLALALGGSISRGLGTPRTSDVDFYIYVKGAGKQEVRRCENYVRAMLRSAGLKLCKAASWYDIEDASTREEVILSFFTNLFLYCRSDPKTLACQLAQKSLREEKQDRQAFKERLEEIYLDFSGIQEPYVVGLFLRNIAPAYLSAEEMRLLCKSKQFIALLERAARPYLEKRKREVVPFPKELEAL